MRVSYKRINMGIPSRIDGKKNTIWNLMTLSKPAFFKIDILLIIILLVFGCSNPNKQVNKTDKTTNRKSLKLSFDSIYFNSPKFDINSFRMNDVNNLDRINGIKGFKFGLSLLDFEIDLRKSKYDKSRIKKIKHYENREIIIYELDIFSETYLNANIETIDLIFYKKKLSSINVVLFSKEDWKRFESVYKKFNRLFNNPNIKLIEGENINYSKYVKRNYYVERKGIRLKTKPLWEHENNKLFAIWQSKNIRMSFYGIDNYRKTINSSEKFKFYYSSIIINYEWIKTKQNIDDIINSISNNLRKRDKEINEKYEKERLLNEL